ncbi:MAG: DUF58 domain-containing protein [Alphaproteobacteria bacterium]|nr:DUF58 domain-containing protein [Alphaproteobacteria bacterium]
MESIRARAESLGESLPGLLIEAERVAATVAQGIHGRRRVGMGETFWQYRPFEAHDAASSVDWRRSARSDALYVRETEWEAAQSVWLWADGSASMDYASDRRLPRKTDRARLLLLASAALLLRGGERVALMGVGERPAMGRAVLERLSDRLLGGAGAAPAAEGEAAGLPPSERLPRGAQALLFGDFLAPIEAVEERLGAFAAQQVRGAMIQIMDPAEEALPFTGRTRFLGMESEGDLTVGRAEALRARYVERLTAHRDALGAAARAAGWRLLVHHTDQPPEQALLTLYMALAHDSPHASGVGYG